MKETFIKIYFTYTFLFVCFLYIPFAYSWEKEIEVNHEDRAAVDEKVHESITAAGILVDAPELERHLVTITRELTGSLPGTVPPYRIKIISSSEVNAFSLSDGTIYISLGMFGIIENDAQLAMLLAHEISHIKLEHHILFRYELHKQTAQNLFWGGNTPYNLRTALSGFSISQEQQADSVALFTLIDRGFNAWSGMKLLQSMYIWLKYKERKIDSATSTHPTLSKRYFSCKNHLKLLHFNQNDGFIGDSSYQTVILKYQPKTIDLLRQSNSVNELYVMTSRKISLNSNIPDWHYLRGSLMERFHPVDSFRIAEAEFSKALKLDPSFTISLRDIGWLFLKNKQYDSARTYLSQYLIHNPNARDSSLILYYLESIGE